MLPFSALDQALDEVSYEWMLDTHPQLVGAIHQEVARGAQPAQIRRQVMTMTNRPDLARRCEQVARFLANDEGA